MSAATKAVSWAKKIAADPSHGYSQATRWGPDYDCSSLVIQAWENAGVPVKAKGATYTGNMLSVFRSCGFKDVTSKVNLSTGSGLKVGDVLLWHSSGNQGHTAMYAGDGEIVHARGQSYGSSATGDQGSEIAVTDYYRGKWQYVLRYSGSGTTETQEAAPAVQENVGTCSVKLGMFVDECVSDQIKSIQILLNARGYRGKDGNKLTVDGEMGPNTMHAIETLQKKAGMKNISFGTVAAATWLLILNGK